MCSKGGSDSVSEFGGEWSDGGVSGTRNSSLLLNMRFYSCTYKYLDYAINAPKEAFTAPKVKTGHTT